MIPSDEKIRTLLKHRFPDLEALEKMDLSRVDQIGLDRWNSIRGYEIELKSLSALDLSSRYTEEIQKQTDELQALRLRDDESLFFNMPDADADFDAWNKMPYWDAS